MVAYYCEKPNPRGSPFLVKLTPRPRRNDVLTQITLRRYVVGGRWGKSRIEDSDSGVRKAGAAHSGKGKGLFLNCESWIGSCLLTSRHRRLPSAYCRLPSAFEGSSSRRDTWPVPHSTTRCHSLQGKKELVTLKSEGTMRACL